MALKFTVQEVTVDNVVKGKNRYSVATVVHTYNGQNREQKIMSFANPAIFEQVKGLKSGDVINVEITKNDAGYNQWAKITQETDSPPENKAAPTGGKVTGSNYETREERAARQALIVRQSALAQSVAFHGPVNTGTTQEEVLNTAQAFVNWVFEKPDLWDQPNDNLDEDVAS